MTARVQDHATGELVGRQAVPQPDEVPSVLGRRRAGGLDLECGHTEPELGDDIDLVLSSLAAKVMQVYRIAPRHKLTWRREVSGALLATVWWLAVLGGFGACLQLASNTVFGLLGGAFSLLLWLYLLAMGLLARRRAE